MTTQMVACGGCGPAGEDTIALTVPVDVAARDAPKPTVGGEEKGVAVAVGLSVWVVALVGVFSVAAVWI
jgi:hypothetical protein